jgi:8-oxo-dGTP diphosphatase
MEQKRALDSAPEKIVFCPICATPLETKPVGDKPRRVCPSCNYTHFTDPKVGVGVLLLKDDHILLVKRAMMPQAGKWSIPAGYLDYGEDPKLTATREIFEETGLEVEITDIFDIYHNPEAVEDGGASIFILYQAHLVGGDLIAGDDAEEVGFFPFNDLPDIAFSSTQDVILRWKSGALSTD